MLTETVDNTPVLLDFVSDENLNEYEVKAYKFRNNKYMKDFSTKNINIFDHDIEHIKFNGKIIYSNGDELEDCDL